MKLENDDYHDLRCNGVGGNNSISNISDLHRNLSQSLNFRGLPINSKQYAPLILLVPDLSSHANDSSISFV